MPRRLVLTVLLPALAAAPSLAMPAQPADKAQAMVREQQRAVRDALPDARRGDDPAGPPADERLNRITRKVGGNSVRVRVLRLPLDR